MIQNGGKLIGQGSFGCVFHPSLNCEKNNTKNNKKKVSKVYFTKNSSKELTSELRVNKLVQQIHGNENWSVLWNKQCKLPPLNTIRKQDEDIMDCLEDNNISENEFNKFRMMLIGDYAGITFYDYVDSIFNKSSFISKVQFKNNFLKVMKIMKPLFIGITEMYNHNIGHNDIKDSNVMVLNGKAKLIDFGFTYSYISDEYYKKRSSLEFLTDRIYTPYPYEFIYLYAPLELLEQEKQDLDDKIYRSLHNRYNAVHTIFFGRSIYNNLTSMLYRYIDGLKSGKTIKYTNKLKLLSLIDTYSLGFLLPYTLYKISLKYKSTNKLKNLCKLAKVKPFIDLFRSMTTPDYFNRNVPEDCLDRYLELEKLYLSSNKRTKKK